MKLLKAFIEASGFDVEEVDTKTYGQPRELHAGEKMFGGIKSDLEFQGDGLYREVTHHIDYKVTKKEVSCPGDLFSLGCQVANDDIRCKLKGLGFELDKNQMHDVMETIIFHIARR